jgi:CAAX prenyl protease-like protein
MTELLNRLRASPMAARVAPFLIFAAFTSLQGKLGEGSQYWLYTVKTVLGALLVWLVWPAVRELRWTFSTEAVLVGIGVILFWILLDPFYPKLTALTKPGQDWNPIAAYGGATLSWFFIVTRIAGATLVVPPLEEMFYRSFVYRYVISAEFEEVSLKRFHPGSMIVTSIVFGVSHREWLAGILCGCAYQWLVLRRGHLGDALTAHAISNLLLGLWVVYKGAWHFW